MNRAINAAATKLRFVRRIYNSIDSKFRYVGFNYFYSVHGLSSTSHNRCVGYCLIRSHMKSSAGSAATVVSTKNEIQPI